MISLSMKKAGIILLYVIYLTGSFAFMVEPLKGLMMGLTPFVLLLTGVFILRAYPGNKHSGFKKWFLVSFVFVSLLEIIGIKTGFVFGRYHYSGIMGFAILGFPVIIALNWIMITFGGIAILDKFQCPVMIKSLLVGLIAVAYDYFLEPVAIRLNFWSWEGGLVPWQNYSAWLIIATIMAYGFYRSKLSGSYSAAAHHLLAQFLFFVVLCVF